MKFFFVPDHYLQLTDCLDLNKGNYYFYYLFILLVN